MYKPKNAKERKRLLGSFHAFNRYELFELLFEWQSDPELKDVVLAGISYLVALPDIESELRSELRELERSLLLDLGQDTIDAERDCDRLSTSEIMPLLSADRSPEYRVAVARHLRQRLDATGEQKDDAFLVIRKCFMARADQIGAIYETYRTEELEELVIGLLLVEMIDESEGGKSFSASMPTMLSTLLAELEGRTDMSEDFKTRLPDMWRRIERLEGLYPHERIDVEPE